MTRTQSGISVLEFESIPQAQRYLQARRLCQTVTAGLTLVLGQTGTVVPGHLDEWAIVESELLAAESAGTKSRTRGTEIWGIEETY